MKFIKGFVDFIPLFISLIPILIIIGFVIFIIYIVKNKIKIKLRTFKGKGFRPVRGNFGLYVYCGKQGQGKTYSMVEYLLDNKDKIQVYCNIAGIKGLEYHHFTGFKELLELKQKLDDDTLGNDKSKQLVFVYDEIFTEIIKGSKLSKDVMDFLCQMRKRKIIFLTTCQEWAELPLSYRRFCRFQIDCDMRPFLWSGFLIKTFKDAEHMKWSNDEQEHIAPLVETTITKCRKKIADSYDTFLRISSFPGVSATPQGGEEEKDVKLPNGISQDKVENMPDWLLTSNK